MAILAAEEGDMVVAAAEEVVAEEGDMVVAAVEEVVATEGEMVIAARSSRSCCN